MPLIVVSGFKSVDIPDSVKTMGSGAFGNLIYSQTINCEASERPTGWDEKWNKNVDGAGRAIIRWNVTMSKE